MNPWWVGLSPAQTTVQCDGQTHRLRWEAGELHAADHDDPEGERALAALGGQRCTCVDVLDAWDRHRDDPHVLVLATRGPADRLAAQPNSHRQLGVSQPQLSRAPRALARHRRGVVVGGGSSPVLHHSGVAPHAPLGGVSKAAQADNELITLLGLGGGVQDRLVATVAAAWTERLARPDRELARVRPQLHAALYGRVLASIPSWLGGSGLETELEMIAEAAKPTLTAEDRGVRVELPFGWLVDVWAKGIATIWGRFCLAAATTDQQTWKLLTVGPGLGPPEPIEVRLPEAAVRDTP